MTLIISTITPSGIILTADSRQTYKNIAGAIRVASDNALKLYKLTDFAGVSIAGKAFLSDKGAPIRDVGYFINKFKQTENLARLEIKDIAIRLNEYLGNIFVDNDIKATKEFISKEIIKLGGKDLKFSTTDGHLIPYSYIDKDGNPISTTWAIDTINMIVAGIDSNKVGRAYSIVVPKGIIMEKDTLQCGALWCGQTDVLTCVTHPTSSSQRTELLPPSAINFFQSTH